MRTERKISRHDWEHLRGDIDNITKEKGFTSTDFRQLRANEDWETIEANIYHTFCSLTNAIQRPVWLWEHFKLDTFSLTKKEPYKLLDQIIDNDEIVWFFVNGDKDKFWFYEGKIKAIATVIEESTYLDELYVASKTYQWLICINHHDILIATGHILPDKLKKLKATIQSSR